MVSEFIFDKDKCANMHKKDDFISVETTKLNLVSGYGQILLFDAVYCVQITQLTTTCVNYRLLYKVIHIIPKKGLG